MALLMSRSLALRQFRISRRRSNRRTVFGLSINAAAAALSIALVLMATNSSAWSKDLAVLTRVLYAAFFIEQGAAICSVPSVRLSENDRTLFKNTTPYAAHIKQMVTSDLAPDEVASILKSAADRARGELQEVINVIKSWPPDQEYAQLSLWCSTKMNSFAAMILNGYARDQEKVDSMIYWAKRDIAPR
jgi:hypothetical protein